MLTRRNILPKTLVDLACCTLVFLIIPTLYYFELFIVLPTYYTIWSTWYNIHFCLGNFATFNLITNLVAMVLVDTSVKGRVMSTELKSGWSLCSVCEILAPPRSHHCEICRTCILKRDHHCMFSGCCIGHDNNRYFIMFVIYVAIATIYSTYFNSHFIWVRTDFASTQTWIKIVFPLAMLIYENTVNQLYLFLCLLVVIAMCFSIVLCYFHVNLMLSGQITHERNYKKVGYNFGVIKNIEMVFGEKWFLTWLNPFIISKLPHDGINWEPQENLKNK